LFETIEQNKKSMSIVSKNIEIKDLVLWDENARFPDKYFNQDESELINFFLSKPDFKIKSLIEAIIKDFDLPQLEKIVVWNDGEQNIVLEGNRRLTAYKILCNPQLSNDKKLQQFLETENLSILISENFKLECIVVENREDAFRYIDRKHYNGNNEVGWKDTERAQYSKIRGSENPLELIKIGIAQIVRELEDFPSEMKEQVLGTGYVTTFFRTITTKPAQKLYGYYFEDGKFKVRDVHFKEKLKVVIFSILNKQDIKGNKIDSRTLNKKEDVEKFLDSIKFEDSHKVDEKIKENTTENIFGEQTINIGKSKLEVNTYGSNTSGKSRQIPSGLFHTSDVPFKIRSSSLRILYEELRLISVKDFPNATHDLLRSFLECSLIFFFKEICEFDSIKKSDTHNPKLGEMLTHLVNKRCSKVTDENLINALRQIKTDFDQPYSLERMNMINHNENCASTEKDVRKTWAQLESLFKIILNP
jgi:hypothetical protein